MTLPYPGSPIQNAGARSSVVPQETRRLADRRRVPICSRLQPNPGRLDLLEHPVRQAEVHLVLPAIRVTDDRRDLKAAREIEDCRGVVENRVDLVTAADVQR